MVRPSRRHICKGLRPIAQSSMPAEPSGLRRVLPLASMTKKPALQLRPSQQVLPNSTAEQKLCPGPGFDSACSWADPSSLRGRGHQSRAAHISSGAAQTLEPHLAALQSLGSQNRLLQPALQPRHAALQHAKHAMGQHSKQSSGHKSKHAVLQTLSKKKQAIDMFGLAPSDTLQGTAVGLVISRPASSLW